MEKQVRNRCIKIRVTPNDIKRLELVREYRRGAKLRRLNISAEVRNFLNSIPISE